MLLQQQQEPRKILSHQGAAEKLSEGESTMYFPSKPKSYRTKAGDVNLNHGHQLALEQSECASSASGSEKA
ncbi:hypothetical protein Y1Q_0017533 [Alligator mississippiensis]|uniref:Uncharacterized protein n=1 Tax=Alligator mississippiensis TaxID=8496 RepID=A0A151P2A7_ALLMI|nr:hypothetical protein Y1Q_0017533 [Alligator mississippiensis]